MVLIGGWSARPQVEHGRAEDIHNYKLYITFHSYDYVERGWRTTSQAELGLALMVVVRGGGRSGVKMFYLI